MSRSSPPPHLSLESTPIISGSRYAAARARGIVARFKCRCCRSNPVIMKRILAALIISLLCAPVAQALTLCPMTCAPPILYYGQFFQQCSEITVTAAEELGCMRDYVAADPPPPIAARQVRAFFKRGWSIIAAMRNGLISDAQWTNFQCRRADRAHKEHGCSANPSSGRKPAAPLPVPWRMVQLFRL
jgi:hypothetical protein